MKKIILRVARNILRLFYSQEILSGKWFTKYRIGYKWAFLSIPRRIMRRDIKVPYSKNATIFSGNNLDIDPSSINCLQSDIYLNNRLNKVTIGKNCYIASHVGIITEQHDLYNLEAHTSGKEIKLGDWCWIGMNAVIMPGVELGDHTTVGANSVVTKSFPKGYVVVAGVPARVIRTIDKNDFEEKYL